MKTSPSKTSAPENGGNTDAPAPELNTPQAAVRRMRGGDGNDEPPPEEVEETEEHQEEEDGEDKIE